MLIRCRSKTGTARYELRADDDVTALVEKILADAPRADTATISLSNQPKGGETLVSNIHGSLSSLGIKHGDLLFISYQEHSDAQASSSSSNGMQTDLPSQTATPLQNGTKHVQRPWEGVVEEPIDTYWEAHDGLIKRPRDSRMCRHGDKSMCDHCMPLEPYDAKYQAEHQIKHLSFHAYLRKRDIGVNKTTAAASNTFIPPLSQPDYKVKVPCPSGSHPAWPAGICTKCQPSAVTLALQQYRMVDHVEFASADLIENMLKFWRKTGMQRFGWLLGRYEAYDIVPMGVKAVVEAIHEPPQEGDVDGLRLGLPWEDAGKIDSLAQMCGLKVVGMIFTDLTAPPAGVKDKAAITKRHKDSFFLSSLEALFAAKQQMQRPNSSRFSDTGRFSSKFVTCVVTGNLEGAIAVDAYQVSDQGMALVEADMVEPSVDPGIVRITEDTSASVDITKKRYIPDVFYTYINEYKLQVKESAKPCFPTDYLLVSLTNGFPNTPNPLFIAPANSAFPVENRQGLEDQTLEKALGSLNKIIETLPQRLDADGFEMLTSPSSALKGKQREDISDGSKALTQWLSDWHLLAFLDTVGIFDQVDMALLAKIATTKKAEDIEALLKSPAWQTLATIAAEHAPKPSARARGDIVGAAPSAPEFPLDADGFPIIPEDHDMMRKSGAGETNTSGQRADDFAIPPELMEAANAAGGGTQGEITCPHCTFVNPPGVVDCEICSLPLQG